MGRVVGKEGAGREYTFPTQLRAPIENGCDAASLSFLYLRSLSQRSGMNFKGSVKLSGEREALICGAATDVYLRRKSGVS